MYNAKYLQPQVSTRGLIAHYKMWDGLMATGKIFDYTSTGKGGTLVDTDTPKTLVPTYPGFDFDGGNDYIVIPYDAGFDVSDELTISVWVYPTEFSGYRGIVTKRDGLANWDWDLYLKEEYVEMELGNLYDNKSLASISTDVWCHLVATVRDSNYRTIYVNGIKQFSTTDGGSLTNSDKDVTIGKLGGHDAYYFNGLIDDVMFFNRELGDTEVKSIYSVIRQRYGV